MKMTLNRKAILTYLSSSNPCEVVYPPYTAKQMADGLNMPLPNVHRTLQDLVRADLVIKEPCELWVVGYENGLGAIKGRWDYQRDGYVYWNALTYEQDKQSKIDRTENAWKAFDRFLTDNYNNENKPMLVVQ